MKLYVVVIEEDDEPRYMASGIFINKHAALDSARQLNANEFQSVRMLTLHQRAAVYSLGSRVTESEV